MTVKAIGSSRKIKTLEDGFDVQKDYDRHQVAKTKVSTIIITVLLIVFSLYHGIDVYALERVAAKEK
jgi:hypothetical protein